MSMLARLLQEDPATPRLTVYDESQGSRMEFSALTLDNWLSKVGNLLDEEFDLEGSDPIVIDLPVSWQAAVIALGAYNIGRRPIFASTGDDVPLVFTVAERVDTWADADECVVVSSDPFGRGVVESGGTLPLGTVDFSPTVRSYGDQYFGQTADIAQWSQATPQGAEQPASPQRVLIAGWNSAEEFEQRVLAPLAGGGSVVVVTGGTETPGRDRIAAIAQAEHVNHIQPGI
ncbi:TIGR03089 family protein [uncultured Corynebacterium sp.]|uniref:TIGR03089 family protein n=1 Tax=uncultured Corynebacterium sp. TaxID=159447 RepID=UPI002889FFED|nr:TIGR03089 family protein [uncultured Corynebacterium sp.]